MYELIKILANINLFSGENVRQTPFDSKYRPIFEFIGAKTKISGRIDLIDREKFEPGSCGVVQVTFIKGMIDDEYFKKDQPFFISEGGNDNLGEGKILEIIN